MQIKVIYLDDEADLCEVFFEEFNSEAVEVRTFCDPKSAVSAAWSLTPHLIFLDYRMPDVTGDQVATEMPLGIPIYLVTGDLEVNPSFPFTGIFYKPGHVDGVRELLKSTISDRMSLTK